MACHHPIPAWKTRGGAVTLSKEPPDSYALQLPCGSCLGCRAEQSRAWALRCQLELQRHEAGVFATLTYRKAPPTLVPEHLHWFFKLFRRKLPFKIKYLATGEYGERFKRPHYHAVIFGPNARSHGEQIQATWRHGYTQVVPVSPGAIAYVAGYCQKKIGYRLAARETVDPETGELYTWQPPFRVMSRRPGIGGHAREWVQSWRRYAVYDGQRIPVPRYLHESWKTQATPEEREELELEKFRERALRETPTKEETQQRLRAAEAMAVARQNLRAARRKYE